jgi:hypothetical protein
MAARQLSGGSMGRTTSVFVSYSHESAEHSALVLTLANRLRADGVDAWLDRYVEGPVEGWPRWIQRMIEDSDFVLCVCTPTYRRAFDGRHDPERGLGVNAEGFIILQDLYDRGNVSDRYIPVLPGLEWRRADIPSSLRAFSRYRFPEDYDNLLRRLTRAIEPNPDPVQPLPDVSPHGYEAQTLVSAYLRPEDYPLDRLAPTEGLFLSRLINPLSPVDPTVVMTVWIAVRGDTQYIVESARIYNEVHGWAGPVAGVAVPPDAAYRFTFNDGSDYEQALDPALSVGPETRRIASFTVTAAPDEPVYAYGRLWIWVRYHTATGHRGSLLLAEPPAHGVMLAKLLGNEVAVGTAAYTHHPVALVTPDGLQRGLDDGAEPPLRLTVFDSSLSRAYLKTRPALLDLRTRCLAELTGRQGLNRALAAANAYPVLARHLSAGAQWAADVLGGMADQKSTSLLLAHLAEHPDDRNAIHGLCVRHLAHPDCILPDLVSAGRLGLNEESAVNVLLVNPEPLDSWITALDYLDNPYRLDWPTALVLVQGDLSARQWRQVIEHAGGPLGRDLHVRGSMHDWIKPPPDGTRLARTGVDRYEVTMRLAPGVHHFKIGDKTWSPSRNLGGRAPGDVVTLGDPYSLYRDGLSHDLTIDLSAAASLRPYRFEVNAADPTQPTVRVVSADIVD